MWSLLELKLCYMNLASNVNNADKNCHRIELESYRLAVMDREALEVSLPVFTKIGGTHIHGY